MNRKYEADFYDAKGRIVRTAIFAETLEEAETIYRRNYGKYRLIKLIDTSGMRAEEPKKPHGMQNHPIFHGVTKIKEERAVMLGYTQHGRSLFDWFCDRMDTPGWTYHVFILNGNINSKKTAIITDAYVLCGYDGIIHAAEELIRNAIKTGKMSADQQTYVYYSETTKEKE